MKEKEKSPSTRSQLGLDSVAFCITDVANGLGAFTATYLQSDRHWDPGTIGTALSAGGIAAMVTQIPAAAMVDEIVQKKKLLIGCSLTVAVCALGIVFIKPIAATVFFEAVIGSVTTFIGPVLTALSLGLVGHAKFEMRTGRTTADNHAGNVVAALLAGWLGFTINQAWVFYLIAILNVMTVGFVLLIRSNEIDFNIARGGQEDDEKDEKLSWHKMIQKKSRGITEALHDKKMIVLEISFFCFQLAGGGILQLVGQTIGGSANGSRRSALFMSAAIVVAQMVMVPTAWASGRLAKSWGRKPLFIAGFVCVPVRAILCSLTNDPYCLVGIQALDGLSAGIFNVVSVLMISDLTKGTSRFNAMQGFGAMAMGLGAGLSSLTGGFVAKLFHFPAAFLTLGIVGILSTLLFGYLLSETQETKSESQ